MITDIIYTCKMPYSPPLVETVTTNSGRIICASPAPGGNEDIGYEKWNNW